MCAHFSNERNRGLRSSSLGAGPVGQSYSTHLRGTSEYIAAGACPGAAHDFCHAKCWGVQQHVTPSTTCLGRNRAHRGQTTGKTSFPLDEREGWLQFRRQTPGTAAPLYRVHRGLHPRHRNPFLAVRTHHLTVRRKAPADRPGDRNGPESPPRPRGPEAFGREVIPRNREL